MPCQPRSMLMQGTSNASTVQPVVDMERTIFCEFPHLALFYNCRVFSPAWQELK